MLKKSIILVERHRPIYQGDGKVYNILRSVYTSIAANCGSSPTGTGSSTLKGKILYGVWTKYLFIDVLSFASFLLKKV